MTGPSFKGRALRSPGVSDRCWCQEPEKPHLHGREGVTVSVYKDVTVEHRTAMLAGWRCFHCGHVTDDPPSGCRCCGEPKPSPV